MRQGTPFSSTSGVKEVMVNGGKKNSISKARSFLYSLARLLGNIQAISKGPKATDRRIGRKVAGKATGRMPGKLFK